MYLFVRKRKVIGVLLAQSIQGAYQKIDSSANINTPTATSESSKETPASNRILNGSRSNSQVQCNDSLCQRGYNHYFIIDTFHSEIFSFLIVFVE